MENTVYAPWEHMPYHLSLAEVQQPLLVLEEFFSIRCPEGNLKFLKEWRHFVLCDQFYNDKNDGPGHLVFVHEWNIKLLEALYLMLLDHKENRYRFMPVTEKQLIAEERSWRWFPKDMARRELADPYLAMNKIFKKIDVPKFREYLKDWLHSALYKQEIDESTRPAEVIKVYDSLEKLYAVAWLIKQRKGNGDEASKNAAGDAASLSPDEVEMEAVKPVRTLNALCPELSDAGRMGLEAVKALILKEVPSVRKIVLLGTYPKPFTYYLLVVIDDSDKTPEHEVGNKIEDNCRPLVSVFAIVHKAACTRQEIANGGHFWNTAMYHGIHVHTADGFTLPGDRPIGKEAWLEAAGKDWHRWGRQGTEFLKGAKRYADDGNDVLAVFMLHQAAESCLIGIVRVLSGYRPSSHNLARMLRLTLLFTNEITDVLALETTEGSQLFNLLQCSYSEARYKNDFRVDEEAVKLLSLKVDLLVKKTEEVYLRVITTS